MANQHTQHFHFGIVGDGPDATIAAYGSSIALGIPEGEQKAWGCLTCTFWNTETMGRFCSRCGSRRFSETLTLPATRSRPPPPTPTLICPLAESSCESNYYSQNGDSFGSLDCQFSPPDKRESRRLGSIDEIPRGASSNVSRLENSFSVLSLLDNDGDTDELADEAPKESQTKPKSALNARDFQMSFANWSVSDQGAWTCQVCSFLNINALHLQCEICGQNRPAKTNQNQNQNQRMMQGMMETSFRTGQKDFMRSQQEKIEEIEERVLLSVRMKEIEEMLDDFQGVKQERNEATVDESELVHKAQLAKEYIDDLERTRLQEREEQDRMEIILASRRQELGMSRVSTESCLQETTPSQSRSQPQQNQVRAQERLLSQWKTSYREKDAGIAEIRRRQQAIMEQWQGGIL